MTLLDWVVVVIPVALVFSAAVFTRRYSKSVADFMSGGRSAGRYLVSNARGQAGQGVTATAAAFESMFKSGFVVLIWWHALTLPVMLLVATSGFVIYRYRETRALTLGQFFEIRYSRSFRLFMGMLAFCAGIINYGIFPAVTGRFFVHFLGLPPEVRVWGTGMPTYIVFMGCYMSCCLGVLLWGGQTTLLVTDAIGGMISQVLYLVIIVAVFWMISWSQMGKMLVEASPKYSLINPFDAAKVHDFNVWYVIMYLLFGIYRSIAWQNQSGFNSSAVTPHEARMAGVLQNWRIMAWHTMMLVLVLGVLVLLRDPGMAARGREVAARVSSVDVEAVKGPIHEAVGSAPWLENKNVPQMQKQMIMPVALGTLLPTGVRGMFVALLMLGLLAADSGHMHSWGSLLVQDVILPWRTKGLTPRQHLRWLRFGIVGVAGFAFVFSVAFQQFEYILLWWQMTMAVFIGGAGSAIIGGLYWKKGTTAGAWAAAVTGAVVVLAGIAVKQAAELLGTRVPVISDLNGMQTSFFVSVVGVLVYVAVSLLTCRGDFNMDRMLHRGEHALEGAAPVGHKGSRWERILGFDENFSRWDKVVAGGLFYWSLFMFVVVLAGSVWNFVAPWSNQRWLNFWLLFGIGIPFSVGVVTAVWFTIGGMGDMVVFFRRLATLRRDVKDDGRVEKEEKDEVEARGMTKV